MPETLALPGWPGSTAPAGHLRSLAAGPVQHVTASPTRHLVVDRSHYQHGLTASMCTAAGISNVILKATEAGYHDPDFLAAARDHQAHGHTTSAYDFLRPGDDGTAFLSAINGVIDPAVRVMADYEAANLADLDRWLDKVCGAGWSAMIYTGGWYWGPHGSLAARYAGYPLVLSGYSAAQPATPRPWAAPPDPHLWQFTNAYRIPGWGSGVDCSVTSDLGVLRQATPTTPPVVTPTPGTPTTEGKMNEPVLYRANEDGSFWLIAPGFASYLGTAEQAYVTQRAYGPPVALSRREVDVLVDACSVRRAFPSALAARLRAFVGRPGNSSKTQPPS